MATPSSTSDLRDAERSRAQAAHVAASARCAGLVLLAVFGTTQIVGCGDDDASVQTAPSPTPTQRPLGSGDSGPEQLIVDMSNNLLADIGSSQLQDLLFPQSSIDYQTLINDFIMATEQLLTQQTVTEQAGYINGDMSNLNGFETNWNAIANKSDPSNLTYEQTLYASVSNNQSDLNSHLGVLEQSLYASEGFSAWMLGAQVFLGAAGFQIQMDPYIYSSDILAANNTTLATDFNNLLVYAGNTRNSILYANIQAAVEKVSTCQDESCNCYGTGSGSVVCDTCNHYTDCNGQDHTWDPSSSKCNTSRSASIVSCGANVYTTQIDDLAWIDEVLGPWRNSLAGMSDQIAAMSKPCAICQDANATIAVDQATIGITGDLPAGSTQDATEWFQAACNGIQTCDFKLAHADFGEPGPFTLVDVSYRCGSDTTQHTVSLSGTGNTQLAEGEYIHLDCAARIANMQATFRGQPVALNTTSSPGTDLSTHSNRGPSIPKLNDDVFAPAGTAYNSSTYAVVLPQDEIVSALFIDLGSVVTLCGGGACTPTIQASAPDVFQIDTSTDGVGWYDWNLFPVAPTGSGLQKRGSIGEPDINARYVRVWARPGDGKYGISELTLFATVNGVVSEVSGHKPSYGPEPLITNGQYAPDGTAYNDTQYATVLADTGTADAQLIDLGQVHYPTHVKVQANYNEIYQLDISADNATWVPWYTVPKVSSSGLQTRDSGPLPVTPTRYVRVYATSGDGKYSVSEVQVFANTTLPVCNGLPDCAFSVAEVIRDQTGAAPTSQDLQDFVVTWTCGSDTTLHTAHAVPWNGDALVSMSCPPSSATCNTSQATTCSVFAPIVMENGNSAAQQRPDDVVYANVAAFPYPICVSSQYPQCTPVIAGKTNYYHTSSDSAGTHDDPACLNVGRAIHDAIAQGSCPAGVGADANTSQNVWPYNVSIGSGQTTTCLPYPADQPALLPSIGCGPYVQ